jgi:hypothetical protein
MRLSDQDKLGEKIPTRGYFDLAASFAHRKIAKGRLNQNIHNAFSSFRQISASGLSGNRLIFIISIPPLDSCSPKAIASDLLEAILNAEIVRSGQNERKTVKKTGLHLRTQFFSLFFPLEPKPLSFMPPGEFCCVKPAEILPE